MENSYFDCLYYPYSRCINSLALKRYLLLFNTITFIDEVESNEHRNYLMKEMSRISIKFKEYEKLNDNYHSLIEDNVIKVISPKEIETFKLPNVSLATRADLEDESFVKLLSKDLNYYSQTHFSSSDYKDNYWQIFQGKITLPLLVEFNNDEFWQKYIYKKGDAEFAWTLDWTCGTTIALNYYLDAADKLNLIPVTTSNTHHNLLIRKLKRIFQNGLNNHLISLEERNRISKTVTHSEMLQLLGEILPDELIAKLSFEEIVKFRSETKDIRSECLKEIEELTQFISIDPMQLNYDLEIKKTIIELKSKLKKYENELLKIRDKLFPSATKALMYGSAGSGTISALATYIDGISPAGIVAASALTISASFFNEAVKIWNEYKDLKRNRSNTIAYLSKLKNMG